MKEAQFILSIDEANIILQALGNMPYIQARPVIEKILKQWNEQSQKVETSIVPEAA